MRKKIIYGVCMLGLVALVATSCKKKDENTNSFAAKFGTLQIVNIDDDDRAYFDPTTLQTYFVAGDQIMVYNINDDPAKSKRAIFQAETDCDENYVSTFVNTQENIGYAPGYHAFYPAGMATTFDGTYQTFYWGRTQVAYPMSANFSSYALQDISIPQAAYTTYDEQFFRFALIFGMARFKVQCAPYNPGPNGVDRYVRMIEVRDNQFNLHGSVRLKPNKIDTAKLNTMMRYLRESDDISYDQMWQEYVISHEGDGLGYSAIGGGKDVVYDYSGMNGGNGAILNNTDDTYLWVGLRPGAFAYGFEVDIHVYDPSANGGEGGTKVITINKWKNPNRLYGIRPGIITTFNCGDITNQVNSAPVSY
jgi:hypothetical protein